MLDLIANLAIPLIMLFIIPMWMNFLLRTYAWLPILGKNGLINSLLVTLGFARANLLYNDFAVLLGMIYNFLPFMILPIYTVLVKMDTDLINAASDLGATKSTIFRKIIFPWIAIYEYHPWNLCKIRHAHTDVILCKLRWPRTKTSG